MADIPVEAIKTLRASTGAGIIECKRALEESGGNIRKAEDLLRERGLAKAAKKAGRETRQGLIDVYIHQGNRVGAMVEVNCETDFVARTPEFRELAHDLAMQVAAMSPLYVGREDMPAEETRPVDEVTLLGQAFIKDPSRTIEDVIKGVIAKVGENIRVRRFARFELGE